MLCTYKHGPLACVHCDSAFYAPASALGAVPVSVPFSYPCALPLSPALQQVCHRVLDCASYPFSVRNFCRDVFFYPASDSDFLFHFRFFFRLILCHFVTSFILNSI